MWEQRVLSPPEGRAARAEARAHRPPKTLCRRGRNVKDAAPWGMARIPGAFGVRRGIAAFFLCFFWGARDVSPCPKEEKKESGDASPHSKGSSDRPPLRPQNF